MKDKTGRDLEVGQVVDVAAEGMLSAFVTQVREGGLVVDGRRQPSLLIVQIAIPIEFEPGTPAPCYITRESDKPKPKDQEEEKKIRRVH